MQRLGANDIYFDKTRDAYVLRAKPELALRRCTEFVGSFFEPYSSQRLSGQLISSTGRYPGRTPSALQKSWETARKKGIEIHEDIAKSIEESCPPTHATARRAIDWLHEHYPTARHAYAAEAIVYDESTALAGTLDLIISNTSRNQHILLDWKTSRVIDIKSPYHKRGVRGPALNWEDCNYIRYSLQLSLYRYLLEANYGFNIDEQFIIHITDTGLEPIPCRYMKREVELMLEFEGLIGAGAETASL